MVSITYVPFFKKRVEGKVGCGRMWAGEKQQKKAFCFFSRVTGQLAVVSVGQGQSRLQDASRLDETNGIAKTGKWYVKSKTEMVHT